VYGCETWSRTLRDEHKPRVFEIRVLRKTIGPKRDGVTGECKDCIKRSCMICTAYQTLSD
jgi:hypothetical protein